MKRIIVLAMIAAFLAFAAMPSTAQAGAEVQWKMQSFMPAASNLHKYLQEFCDLVQKATNGRMKITLFPANALFPTLKVFQNVKAGVVQMAHTSAVFYQGEWPDGIVLSPPFGSTDAMDYWAYWYYRGVKELAAPFYEKNGLMTRGRIIGNAEPIWSRVPIRSIEDFKGKKIRMSGAPAKFFTKKLGASVIMLSPGDLFTALNNGTIDACEFSGGSVDYALGLHKVTKYMIMPQYLGAAPTEFLINKKAYEALPKDIKLIFDLCCDWAEVQITQKIFRDDAKAVEKMIKGGDMEVIWLPDEDVAKIRAMALDFWLNDMGAVSPFTKKAMDIYVQMAKERGLVK
ncbi:MAG: TRAP transporter substrate-binding protein DctP [Desulfarculaceae bacterium]|nr:TRAP transporter substrate-binding protein DctP [Desulfarculaceae bacterium]MCF8071203.1 TRAP transporter substrate-binding protein DctP [Desulfarculaceae bacterium]MCF8101194.1 TRAP transporter substrate-binding protein DctP [Desulfarculaceae bacterium]MCF8115257.1 TRAP transporter substrate-binding protein DctP [Desulfarculaceae bacterium]